LGDDDEDELRTARAVSIAAPAAIPAPRTAVAIGCCLAVSTAFDPVSRTRPAARFMIPPPPPFEPLFPPFS